MDFQQHVMTSPSDIRNLEKQRALASCSPEEELDPAMLRRPILHERDPCLLVILM